MTKDELTNWINDEITLGGSISIELPKKEIKRVIEKATKEVYQLYADSVEQKYMFIPKELFYRPEFRQDRVIQFADCITAVTRFQEAHKMYNFYGFNDPDMSFQKAVNSAIYFGSQFNNEWLTSMQVAWLSWDQMKTFTLVDIRHYWNPNTHRLQVLGHDPKTDVICEMMVKVPEEALWEDGMVRKYICGKCKVEVSRLIGTFTSNLIGGITVNSGLYKDEGTEEITEAKEYFTNTNKGYWFVSFP